MTTPSDAAVKVAEAVWQKELYAKIELLIPYPDLVDHEKRRNWVDQLVRMHATAIDPLLRELRNEVIEWCAKIAGRTPTSHETMGQQLHSAYMDGRSDAEHEIRSEKRNEDK